ncbi:phosphatidylinositide phosphatase SAC2 isoform X2 [Ranitomeya variabilis]|uniref:phosphatidylinositide phosphatase SAC2 isoform X2 n=1 Tax=Ranitomeya variabilis TaxID=490064 RepID=UPI004055CC38
MELFQAKDHYILQSGERALWCSRHDGTLSSRPATDLLLAWNPICLGLVEGIIGKVQLHTDLPWWLLLIRQKSLIGVLPESHEIYKISKIAVIPLSAAEPQDLELELCKKHHFGINKPEKITQSPDDSKFLLKTLTQIKSNVSVPNKKKGKDDKEKERLERRLLEELFKMFMDSDSFYYSWTYNLTNSVQRQNTTEVPDQPLWKRVDERFFWNRQMLQDLIELEEDQGRSWILPIIQGFVQIEELVVSYNESSDDEKSSPETPPQEATCVDDVHPRFLVALISRRSRHRAGMRYKRRGVDKNGNVANYVETEQFIHVHNHTLSFVQTRGSVPVFWSQAGYRYNPRPRLDKGEVETNLYFCSHFNKELEIYKKQVLINLVDQTGREKIIGDAYMKQVLMFNCSNLTYVTFDFHEHCRGMKFENVQTLTDAISDIILDMKWCWVDQAGVICKQDGIFRVNCMDCLDRTNVVQAAIARVVMEQQGDFTRTGERKLAGVMKDGVNSANRYYINRFKDAYRQAVIDLMQGIPMTEDLYSIFTKEKEHEALERQSQRSHQELINQLLQNYMQMLLPDDEKFHGGWALIDCDPSLIDATHKDVDVLLLLSNCAYYVAYYDDEVDKVSQYQRLNLEDLEKIEIGPEPTFFGKPKFSCMRLHYKYQGNGGYFHTLRAVTRSLDEDGKDTLLCIAEMLRITKQALGSDVFIFEKKLERKSSKPHVEIMGIRSRGPKLGINTVGLAQSKNFLMSKFSSLNQKVKQTNIGNLRKLGTLNKAEVKGFLKPNLQVSLWKSDSSLENPGSDGKVHIESDLDLSSDSDSYHSDDYIPKSDNEGQLIGSLENIGQVDYVLPSCGIIASVPRLGSRSQSITSAEINVHIPAQIQVTKCEASPEENVLIDFGTPIDVYCHQFVQDAQTKDSLTQSDDKEKVDHLPLSSNSGLASPSMKASEAELLNRPSQLDVSRNDPVPHMLSVDPAPASLSGRSSPGSGSAASPADSSSSRAVSPFAKIRSSVVQVANITHAGLAQGINFAVAKVQKSPDPETIVVAQKNDFKEMFTQCQTRIIQI